MNLLALLLAANMYAHSSHIKAHTTLQEQCLAVAIYKEAGSEPEAGKRAVLDVIRTRMKKRKKTACQIIREPKQFSWNTAHIAPTKDMLLMLKRVDKMKPVVYNAQYFHNISVSPRWSWNMPVKAKVGNHIFY